MCNRKMIISYPISSIRLKGCSVPRNKELMRIFKDLDLVEHLGSGVPRILKSYGKECFKFTENFLRMTFPATGQVTEQVPNKHRTSEKNNSSIR